MSQQTAIIYSLSVVAAAAVFCLAFFLQWYWRRERRERRRFRQVHEDITDLTILFQTMRDLVRQQKRLAQEFNEDLDRKLVLVKQILQQSVGRNEELYAKQQSLAANLEEARDQIESLHRQYDTLAASHGLSGEDLPQSPMLARGPRLTPVSPAPHTMVKAPGFPKTDDRANTTAAPEPKPVEQLTGTGVTRAPHAPWSAGELKTADKAPPVHQVHPEAKDKGGDPSQDEEDELAAPGQSHDKEAAREAFRSLLDLDSGPAPDTFFSVPSFPSPPTPTATAPDNGGGPRHNATPASQVDASMRTLQRRVEDYHRAGMEVTDIARELGVGKGEVRLMLSLMQQQQR